MKRYAPAAERNREPILAALREVLPRQGLLLEVASGTGQHAVHFAAQLPSLQWQPSDGDAAALSSIDAWRAEAGLPNVRPAVLLDVTDVRWPVEAADAMFCANMIHIAPWAAAEGLLRGAGRVLSPGGPLALYGPFFREGVETAPSNLAFDQKLRDEDPAWGVRSLEALVSVASTNTLSLERVIELPSNNCLVVFRHR